jgi:hypothetical protein
MLQFRKVAPQESTLKSIGTVAEFAGVGGYHQLTGKKNFKGTLKDNGKLTNVTIAVYNAQGERAYVNCSEQLSIELRACKTDAELKAKLDSLALLPILELPQVERDETKPNFGKPIMVADEETGEMKPLIIYTISKQGGEDMSSTRVSITEEMLNKKLESVAINLEDLIAM